MWPVLVSADGTTSPMTPDGPPVVKELNAKDLSVQQPLSGGGSFTIVCQETAITCVGVDAQGQPLRWAWHLVGGARQKSVVRTVTPGGVSYQYSGSDYQLRLSPDSGSCLQLGNGDLQFSANNSGKLVLLLNAKAAESPGRL
jgi:hypothetical protein